MSPPPLVLDVKRSSLDDGPGIRSVVFFKGCPLRCVWCQNPESLSPKAEIQRDVQACAGCGSCRAACPRDIARPAAQIESRAACTACGACVEACPAAARRVAGEHRSADALLDELLLDEPFYRRSGGGVTLSGGEPTLFVDFVGPLAAKLRAHGIHVLLETCGQFSWEPFATGLLPHLSAIYFDLKLADDEQHRRHCGTGNRRILDNLRRLSQQPHVDVTPRIPLVPGLTDDADNLRALAEIIGSAGLGRAALMPYNPLWLSKRRGLSLPLPYDHAAWMPAEAVGACERCVENAGLEIVR